MSPSKSWSCPAQLCKAQSGLPIPTHIAFGQMNSCRKAVPLQSSDTCPRAAAACPRDRTSPWHCSHIPRTWPYWHRSFLKLLSFYSGQNHGSGVTLTSLDSLGLGRIWVIVQAPYSHGEGDFQYMPDEKEAIPVLLLGNITDKEICLIAVNPMCDSCKAAAWDPLPQSGQDLFLFSSWTNLFSSVPASCPSLSSALAAHIIPLVWWTLITSPKRVVCEYHQPWCWSSWIRLNWVSRDPVPLFVPHEGKEK